MGDQAGGGVALILVHPCHIVVDIFSKSFHQGEQVGGAGGEFSGELLLDVRKEPWIHPSQPLHDCQPLQSGGPLFVTIKRRPRHKSMFRQEVLNCMVAESVIESQGPLVRFSLDLIIVQESEVTQLYLKELHEGTLDVSQAGSVLQDRVLDVGARSESRHGPEEAVQVATHFRR